ncbi:MAG: SLC45 family MFS transporter [Chthoniobacterales bacterium]|nr:SLC45 family MFS transporter [Chthoniobacterales bacterium]
MSSHGPTGHHTGKTWKVGTLVYSTTGLVILFGWLLVGDFSWQARERAVTPVAQVMLKQFAVSDMMIGFLVGSMPSALGMFLSPVVGYRSDRLRSRWGRRIPFLLVTTPIAAGAMMALGFVPMGARWLDTSLGESSPGLNACFLGLFGLFWILFEVAAVVGNAIFGALINDVVPTAVIGRFFGLFRAVSLIVGVLFSYFVLGKAEEGYLYIFLTMGLIYGVGFGLMCLKVKEGDYPPPAECGAPKRSFVAAAKIYFRECFTHPYYLWLFGAWGLANLAFNPFYTFSLFYARSVGMSLDQFGKCGAISLLCSLIISYPIGSLADRIHPLRVALISLVLYVVLAGWAALFVRTPDSFAFALIAHGVLAGVFLTGTASLGQRLFPHATFAQFASAATLINGLLLMIMPPLMGAWIDISGHAYHLTFAAGCGIAMLAVACLLVVFRYYHRLGGDKAYAPPE